MKTKKYRSILAASLASAWLSGSAWAVTLPVAQDNSSTAAATFSAATGKSTSLTVAPNRTAYVQFDLTTLPASVTAGSLRNARLRLYVKKLTAAGDLAVSDVTTAWSESAGAAATLGNVIATIPGGPVATKRFVVVDVTAEVNAWLLGAANNGLAISSTTAKVTLGSKEGVSTGHPAELEIDINPTVAASGDTVLSGNVAITGGNNNAQLNVNDAGSGNNTMTVRARPGDISYLLVANPANAEHFRVADFGFHLLIGDGFKPGGGAWGVASDARLKKDVEELTGALDKLLQLRSVSYEYKDPAAIHELSGRQIGFIAQEVEKVFPGWVGERDGMKAVSPKGFESLTVAALRELRAEKDGQIKTLSAENVELKKRLDEIDARESARLARLTALEKAVGTLVADKSNVGPDVRRTAATVNP
jgi:hypothetical protein